MTWDFMVVNGFLRNFRGLLWICGANRLACGKLPSEPGVLGRLDRCSPGVIKMAWLLNDPPHKGCAGPQDTRTVFRQQRLQEVRCDGEASIRGS